MLSFYIDESGYTGFDLLNKQQPFQGASSLLIDEDKAKSLVDKYFPNRKATELKHRNLSRWKSNWESLLNIQKDILQDYMGFTYICDKKFLLTLLFLNSCVEPFFYDQGVDFYQNGQNYALASLIYRTAPALWGRNNYEDILYLFQRAKKSKSDVAILALVEKAKSLIGRKLSENLMPLTMEYDSCIKEIMNPRLNADAAFVVLSGLISHIEKHVSEKYEIIHDTSNNLLKYNQIITKLIENDTQKSFDVTQVTSVNFPLKLSAVSQKDSHLSYGVQLADVLIGGMIEHVMALNGLVKKNDYNQAILELYGDTNILHLLPNLNFDEDYAFRSGTQAYEFIEFMAQKFS